MVTNLGLSLTDDCAALVEFMGQAQQQNPDGTPSALRRKADSGRAAHQARVMSLAKALRITLAKVADDLFEMPMAVIGAKIEDCDGDDVQDVFDSAALLLLLDGPTRSPGAAMLDPLLVGALIQQQTMGRVLPEAPGASRQMTDTDAAVTTAFLDALLMRAATLPDSDADKRLLTGYKFGIRSENVRLLAMALEHPTYKLVTLTVDISGGVRQGQIVLALPVLGDPDDGVPVDEDDPDQDAPMQRRKPENLSETVLGLNIELNVSLARLRMPLGKLGGLRVGDVLALGPAPFDKAAVMTLAGRRLASGVLGQIDGHRALRMTQLPAGPNSAKRRASDRDELDQTEPEPLSVPSDTMDQPEQVTDLSLSAELPDMSDLPELDLPERADLSEVSEIPDRRSG